MSKKSNITIIRSKADKKLMTDIYRRYRFIYLHTVEPLVS